MRNSRIIERNPSHLVYLALAILLLIPFSIWAVMDSPSQVERNLFTLINALPDWLEPVLFVVMQLGAFAAVFVIGAIFLLFRKWHIARTVMSAGTIAWLVSKIMKAEIGRGRPDGIIELFELRNIASGLGYPSGHAAVAFALAFSLAPYASVWQRRVMYFLAFMVGIARVYVGVHLPFDIIGGFLIGFSAALLMHVTFGIKRFSYSSKLVKRSLEKYGHKVRSIKALNVDARSSIVYKVRTSAGKYLLKVYGPSHKSSDWLFKVHRKLVFRHTEGETPFISLKQLAEHEAFMSMYAQSKGVYTPAIEQLMQTDEDIVYTMQPFIKGTALDRLDSLTLKQNEAVWRQLKILHDNDISHGDLRAGNIMLDEEGKLLIIDFDFAQVAPKDYHKKRDIVELMVSLALISSPEETVKSALRVLPKESLLSSMSLLNKRVLSKATRTKLKKRDSLLESVIAEVESQTGEKVDRPAPFTKVQVNIILTIIALGLAAYFLAPQLGELTTVLDHVSQINWWYTPALLAVSFATYLSAGLKLLGAIPKKQSYITLVLLQLAGSFVNRITPSSVGGYGLNTVYIIKQGFDKLHGALIMLLPRVVDAVISVILLIAGLQLVDFRIPNIDIPYTALYVAAGILLAAAGISLFFNTVRNYLAEQLGKFKKSLDIVTDSRQVIYLIGGSLLLTLTFGSALWLSVQAVGSQVSLLGAVVVMLASAVIGSASPAPGGLGVEEASLVTGLSFLGVSIPLAIIAVVLYRLATFWVPIPFGALSFQYLRDRDYV